MVPKPAALILGGTPKLSPHRSERVVLAGNQASARGAVEAGARLAIGYPGTPATLALEYLLACAPEAMRVEWAINEKVALEIAAGHSWAGQRSYVAMKMSGLNVASDALLSIATSGTRGGLVVYVGDDPGMYYGMVEQDSRLLARLAMLPMVEPATPQESKDFTAQAFEVSEAAEVPVFVRGTTTTANTCGPVGFGAVRRVVRASGFPFDLDRYTKAGASRCLRQHGETLARLQRAGELLAHLNTVELTDSGCGVIAAASMWGYLEEALEGRAGPLPNRLRIAVMNPLPDDAIRSLLSRCRRVLVLEELEPLIEERVRALASSLPAPPRVLGKAEGLLSPIGDADPDSLGLALDALAAEEPRLPSFVRAASASEVPEQAPARRWAPRLLTFCPGCPHRSTYTALSLAIEKAGYRREQVIVTGDVGCTILGMNPPFELCRTELAMGSSIALAQGFVYAGVGTPVIATIGDSTFFHAGIPPLLNASAQNVNLTVLVLDNGYASMTGYQPSMGHYGGDAGSMVNPMSIEELAKSARVRRVRKALPYFTGRLSRVLAQALRSEGVHVVIAEAPCVARRPRRTVIPYRVRPDLCSGPERCSPSCLEAVGCPALDLDEAGRAVVDSERCMGCGLCASACRARAIRRELRMRRRG
jgi:indolepyruvate ferredoxin oxidoreductase, alpha subunit